MTVQTLWKHPVPRAVLNLRSVSMTQCLKSRCLNYSMWSKPLETYDALLAAIAPTSGETRTILDPATGTAVGEAPVHTVQDLEAAVTAAAAAQPAWAALGHDARSAALLRAADAVERSAEELALLLSREQGKPLNGPNARFEVGACAAWLRVAASTALDPETVVDDGETRAELHYRPIGVVGAIGPWNWPMMITVWQIAPALRMGNAVVVKPSEYTPLSRPGPGQGPQRGAAGRPPYRGLRRPRRRRPAGRTPRDRQGHVHRLHRHRQGHHQVLRGHHQTPHPGTGRQ